MPQDSDPAAGPATEAAGIAAAESVELDPSDLAGFTAISPSIRHMLNKIDALTAAIAAVHEAEHAGDVQHWCQHPLCRAAQDWA